MYYKICYILDAAIEFVLYGVQRILNQKYNIICEKETICIILLWPIYNVYSFTNI